MTGKLEEREKKKRTMYFTRDSLRRQFPERRIRMPEILELDTSHVSVIHKEYGNDVRIVIFVVR